MRILSPRNYRSAIRRRHGLTLVETMVTVGLFSLGILALVYTQLFGMRQDKIIQSKLGASDEARKGFDKMALEIRSAKIWSIGNLSSTNISNFTPATDGMNQTGNCVQLSLTIDTNQYIRYLFSSNALYRMHSGSSTYMQIARHLTNALYFQAELFDGSIQTNRSHKGVIHTILWFKQYEFPMTMVGPGYYYDYYKMEFRLTPHVPDGP